MLFAIFMAGPVFASLTMSFTDFTSRDLRNPLAINLVGLENYTRLLSDDRFLRSAFNTLYFVVVGIPLTMGSPWPWRWPSTPASSGSGPSSGSASTPRW